MNIGGHDIGVCSGCTGARDMAELGPAVKKMGLEHVHLSLYPLMIDDEKRKYRELAELGASGLKITAGVMGFLGEDYATIDTIRQTGGYMPDKDWPARWEMTLMTAKLAAEMGIKAVSGHVGFINPKDRTSYHVIFRRMREIADVLHDYGIELFMETGQERAKELADFIAELNRSNIAVNFDPANMILYGAGDPIEAVGILGKHIRHVHIKDAVVSDAPRKKWGKEVPFGQGQVNARAFIKALHDVGYHGPLVIEREGGENRFNDIVGAVKVLQDAMV